MRPMYESPEDRDNEDEIMEQLLSDTDFNYYKLPISYGVDFGVYKDLELKGWVEAKARTCRVDAYDTYILSFRKWEQATRLAKAAYVPFKLAVRWADRLGVYTYHGERFCVRHGGRTDRGDSQDQEPVVHIPITRFNMIT